MVRFSVGGLLPHELTPRLARLIPGVREPINVRFQRQLGKHLLIPREAAWGFTMDFTKHENLVDEWLAAFAAALDQRNIDRVLDLFEPNQG